MAITTEPGDRELVEPIDPYEEIDYEAVIPIWPDSSVIDLAKAQLSYDRESDTLFMHFFGRERDAVSIVVDSYRYLLVEPESYDVVGVQVEEFLSQAVRDDPRLILALDVAELRGITPDEVRACQRDVFSLLDRLRTRVHSFSAVAKKCLVVQGYADKAPNGHISALAGCG